MRPPRLLPLLLLALLALAAGCQSARTARKPQRFRDNPGSFTDLTERSAFIDQRVKELTKAGVNKDAAVQRASNEWFASAPVVTESPTAYELDRREKQADLVNYLDQRKESGSR